MTKQDKYKSLTDLATSSGVSNLQVREQDGVLYIDGTAASGDVKDKLWAEYNRIDPDFAGGDLVLNVQTDRNLSSTKAKVITEHSNLNIRKGPGTDQEIVGKAAKDEEVDIISRTSNEWWLVRSKDGEEGYAYAKYLQA